MKHTLETTSKWSLNCMFLLCNFCRVMDRWPPCPSVGLVGASVHQGITRGRDTRHADTGNVCLFLKGTGESKAWRVCVCVCQYFVLIMKLLTPNILCWLMGTLEGHSKTYGRFLSDQLLLFDYFRIWSRKCFLVYIWLTFHLFLTDGSFPLQGNKRVHEKKSFCLIQKVLNHFSFRRFVCHLSLFLVHQISSAMWRIDHHEYQIQYF